MKKFLKIVLVVMSILLGEYLIISFIRLDFNVKHWSVFERIMLGLFGPAISFAVVSETILYSTKKD
jgi:hypothetical protein